MRIAFDVTPLLGERTGVGEFVVGALGALAARSDVELVPFAMTWRGRASLPDHLPAGLAVPGPPMPARPLRAIWRRSSFPPVELWTGPVSVVHGTNFVVPPARHARQVVTVHDLTTVHYPEMCRADTLAYPGLVARAVGRGALVHTPSAFVAREVVEHFGVPPERVRAVHHGVPSIEASSGPSPVGEAPYVLALGTIEPRKGFPDLVAAFDLVADTVPELRLVVAGGDGWGVEAFDVALNAAKHRDRIVRTGYVSGPERAALLANAHVFAYPSLYEGFGFPPLEAMSCGVPVVASSAGALPEVLGDAALLTPPGDVVALARALTDSLDERRRAELVTRGRSQVATYSWTRCAEGLAAVYGVV